MIALLALLIQDFKPPVGYVQQTELYYTGSTPHTFLFQAFGKEATDPRPGIFQKIFVIDNGQGLEVPLPSDCSNGQMIHPFSGFAVAPHEKFFILGRKQATGMYDAFMYKRTEGAILVALGNSVDQSLNDYIVKKRGHPGFPKDRDQAMGTVFAKSWTRGGSAILDVTDDDTRHDPEWYRVTINPKTGSVSPYKRTKRIVE